MINQYAKRPQENDGPTWQTEAIKNDLPTPCKLYMDLYVIICRLVMTKIL